MKTTTKANPLTLWFPGKPNMPLRWWKQYYDTSKIQMRDRCLFADIPLPAALQATKTVDWTALPDPTEAGTSACRPGEQRGPILPVAVGAPCVCNTEQRPLPLSRASRRIGPAFRGDDGSGW
jgi:hypothetical protein